MKECCGCRAIILSVYRVALRVLENLKKTYASGTDVTVFVTPSSRRELQYGVATAESRPIKHLNTLSLLQPSPASVSAKRALQAKKQIFMMVNIIGMRLKLNDKRKKEI